MPSRYGTRSQLGALVLGIDDALGNRDGIPGNEDLPAGTPPGRFRANALAFMARSAAATGLSAEDDERRIDDFVRTRERVWDEPVTTLAGLRCDARFRAEKAIALTRFGRHPNEVTDALVVAEGSAMGEALPKRRLLVQRWRARGARSGAAVVVSPGFLETGRNFHALANRLNERGHDVVVMDHSWAGHSDGRAGAVDRGFGVSRDAAAVAAFATTFADRVVLYGHSMGASAGALAAMTLNDAGLLSLEGPPMPRGIPAVLSGPFFRPTPGAALTLAAFLARVPYLASLKLPPLAVPFVATDPVAAIRFSNHLVRERAWARAETMLAAAADLETTRRLLLGGCRPEARVVMVHSRHDPLADPAAVAEVGSALGRDAHLEWLPGGNHVVYELEDVLASLVDALDGLCARPRPP